MRLFKHIILYSVAVVITLNPLIGIAADININPASGKEQSDFQFPLIDIANQSRYGYTPSAAIAGQNPRGIFADPSYQAIINILNKYSSPDSILTFDDLFSTGKDVRLVLKQSDLDSIRSLYCLTKILPDFENNLSSLIDNLSTADKLEINKLKESTPILDFLADLKAGKSLASNGSFSGTALFNYYLENARKNYSTTRLQDLWQEEAANIAKGKAPSTAIGTLACVTGLTKENITANLLEKNNQYISEQIKIALETNIDIRVLKTLNYLITPKNQGGAGHWRIKVNRILQKSWNSKESTTVKSTLASSESDVACGGDMTAAECGAKRNDLPDLEIENKDGGAYDAYLEDASKNEDKNSANFTSHAEGQAVDISEIDDIRCTKVTKKNLPGSSKKPKKDLIRPIKLAWQTTDGWQESNGDSDTFDLMATFKSLASDSVNNLIGSLSDGEISYEGDLSKANFSEIMGVVGDSLLSNVLGSKIKDISTSNMEGTLKNLGADYLSDYFGLPREALYNTDLLNIEEMKFAIGRSYIESKLGLPTGSLNGATLAETLINIGRRKVELEMNLRSGDLDGFILDQTDPIAVYVGAKVIEESLGLRAGSWPKNAKSFGDIKDSISEIKYFLIKNDPASIDRLLNLDPGTAQNFIDNKPISSSLASDSRNFAAVVGERRMSNTIFGLKYFSMSNSAYQLPGPTKENPNVPDTWAGAIKGDLGSMQTIGIYTLARLLGEDTLKPESQTGNAVSVTENGMTAEIAPAEFGKFVFREWLRNNLNKSGDECNLANQKLNFDFSVSASGEIIFGGNSKVSNKVPDLPITQKITYVDGTTSHQEDYTINEDKAIALGLKPLDLQRMFGCGSSGGRAVMKRAGASQLYSKIISKIQKNNDALRVSIDEGNPEISIQNDTVKFYIEHISAIKAAAEQASKDLASVKTGDIKTDQINTKLKDIAEKIGALSQLANDREKILSLIGNASQAAIIADQINEDVDILTQYLGQEKDEANNKITAINTLISDTNTLVRLISEVLAGDYIKSSDSLTLNQINLKNLDWGLKETSKVDDSSFTGKSNDNDLETYLLFLMLSGRLSPTDALLRFGANLSEGKLGLPANSLLYFVQNYEKRGLAGDQAFFEAIGQAKIEAEFSMPSFYFQGYNTLPDEPDFQNDPSAIAQYSDNTLIAENIAAFTQYQSGPLSGVLKKQASFLGTTAKTAGEVTTSASEAEIIQRMMISGWPGYPLLKASAEANWQKENKAQIEKSRGSEIAESTLDDVTKNIEKRGYTDLIRSGQDDLLFRMGLPVGKFSALSSNSNMAWQLGQNRSEQIDSDLGIKSGSTKSLFTKEQNLSSAVLSSDEKNLVESNAKISGTTLESYLRLSSGEITLDDAKISGTAPDYIFQNPYSSSNACAISYTKKDGFIANETTLQNDSFCYYDVKGRHCFESLEEAGAYQRAHEADKFQSAVDEIAYSIATILGDAGSQDKIKANLEKFVNDHSQKNAFNSITEDNQKILSMISEKSGISLETLGKLFTRDDKKYPVSAYKRLVGQALAQRVITSRLFSEAGVSFDPSVFNLGALYQILSGDLRPLYTMGASYLDKSLNLKPGTSSILLQAKSTSDIECALKEAGSSMLGDMLGLGNFSIRSLSLNGLAQSVGESKVEQSLNLPRGSFYGSTFMEAAQRAGLINIALGFNIPLSDGKDVLADGEIVSQADLRAILGPDAAKKFENTTAKIRLEQIRDYASYGAYLNKDTAATITSIEGKIKNRIGSLSKAFGLAGGSISVDLTKASNEMKEEATTFISKLNLLDSSFQIPKGSTFLLIAGQNNVSPDTYNKAIGAKAGQQVLATTIADRLGLNYEKGAKAYDLLNNFQNIFSCRGKLTNQSGDLVCLSDGKPDEWYQHYDKLYASLDQIFTLSLDEKAGFPEGTIGQIISDPKSAGPTLFKIGAEKLDAQFGLSSDKMASFSALFAFLGLSNGGPECAGQSQNSPEALQASTGVGDAEKKLADIEIAEPKTSNADADNNYLDWKSARNKAASDLLAAKKALSDIINPSFDICKIQSAGDIGGKIDEQINTVGKDWAKLTNQSNLVQWGKAALSQKIHDLLYNVKASGPQGDVRIGVDMPVSDIDTLVNGNMKSLEIATLAIGANYAYISADNVRTTNCNSSEGECKTAVPEAMRASYDDIKAGVLGITPNEDLALAAWIDANGIYDNPEVVKAGGTAGAPSTGTGNFGNNLIDALAATDTNADTANIVGSKLKEQYGYSTNLLTAKKAELSQKIATNRQAGSSSCQQSGQSNGSALEECLAAYDAANGNPTQLLDKLNDPAKYYTVGGANYSPANQESVNMIRQSTRKIAQENLSFKFMDAAFWKLDENVYSGFARDLFKGNAEIRTAALAKYIKNGVANGHLFGLKFSALPEVDQWLDVLNFGRDLIAGNSDAFSKFAGTNGFNTLTDFISQHSDDWFGFNISSDIAKGIIVGLGTNDWGLSSISLDNIEKGGATHDVILANGQKMTLPTLGGSLTNIFTQKLFGWADKKLGLNPGQTFSLFQKGVALYKSWQIYEEISQAKDIATLSTQAKSFMDSRGATDLASGQEEAKQAFTAAKGAIVYEAVSLAVQKLLGAQIGGVEEDLGMIPGTLEGMVTVLVYNAVAPMLNLAAINPWAAVAIAIAGYLLGEKVYYYCSADGYYPEIGKPNADENDISGIGVWGGRIKNSQTEKFNELQKQKYILAAQYKARRLISDMIQLQNRPRYVDHDSQPIIPVQIMTGRQEDVDYFDGQGSISDYICKPRLGDEAVSCGGICGTTQGDGGCKSTTRMGIWRNPQNVPFTHIGF